MDANGLVPSRPAGEWLHEAMLTWGDPELVAEFRHCEIEGAYATLGAVLGRETEKDRREQPYTRVTDRLREALVRKLHCGELIATCIVRGAPPDARPTIIQAERWGELKVDFDRSSATDGDVVFTLIRVSAPEREVSCEGQGSTSAQAPSLEPTLVVLQRASSIVLSGQRIALPNLPLVLVLLLAKAAAGDGRVVATRHIEQGLWGVTDKGRVADVVYELRRRIASASAYPDADSLIVNRPGHGYMLTLPASAIRIEE